MQHFGAAATLYETPDHNNYFTRSDVVQAPAFTLEGSLDSDTASGLLDLTDTLEKQLEASNLALGVTDNTNTNNNNISTSSSSDVVTSDHHHHQLHVPPALVDFDLDVDNGQLLHDMLQQQQPSSHSSQPITSTTTTWEENVHVLQEMLMQQQHQQQQQHHQQQSFLSAQAPKFRRESELLSLLQLPRCASGAISGPFNSGSSKKMNHIPVSGLVSGGGFGDIGEPSHHLTQPTSSSSFRHLLHTLPSSHHTSGIDHHHLVGSSSKSTLGLMRPPGLLDLEERDVLGNGHDQSQESRLFPSLFEKREFTFGKGAGDNRGINHFATERQRREYLNEKYQTLRSLVPNPSKADRASIVADAIEYVKELKRTVQELQLLVEEKRRGSSKRRCKSSPGENAADGGATDMESSSVVQQGGTRVSKETNFLGDGSQLRSSWLQRTSQMGTHIDVRIVDDEVNIKLTQRRRRNYVLLAVLRSLNDLHLDLLHANGASIGEHHIFMFNTKIMEGTSTFAGQVATKLIDAVDRHITLASSGL